MKKNVIKLGVFIFIGIFCHLAGCGGPDMHSFDDYDATSHAVKGLWTLLPGGATDIGVGAQGQVYVIGTDNTSHGGRIYKWTGNSWQRTSGIAERIDVDQYGRAWVVNRPGMIFRGDGNDNWTQLPGRAVDIGVGKNGEVYVVGAENYTLGGVVYRWTGSSWQATKAIGHRISVDHLGRPWVVDKIGNIIWSSGNDKWHPLPGRARDIGVGADGHIYVAGKENPDYGGVYKWTGSTWQNISGLASNLDVGPDGSVWITNKVNQIWTTKAVDIKKMVVMSLGGSSSTDIHPIVSSCAKDMGYFLVENQNWKKDQGDTVASNSDAERIRDKINDLAKKNGGDKSKLKLVVVGKSAGGVLAWNTFKRHFANHLADFHTVALVMVDPHGSVTNDGHVGPYCRDQDLWWPSGWPSITNFFRVYNVYQWRSGLTGASFPDSKVYINYRILSGDVSHDNIPNHATTKSVIRLSFGF